MLSRLLAVLALAGLVAVVVRELPAIKRELKILRM
jgi:hypothetical protein